MGTTRRAVREARTAAERGAQASARERQLVEAFAAWSEARERLSAARVEHAERVAHAQSALREAMGEGVRVGDERAAARKLVVVSEAWQALDDARAARKEDVATYREAVSVAEQEMRRRIEDAAQLDLWTEEGASE